MHFNVKVCGTYRKTLANQQLKKKQMEKKMQNVWKLDQIVVSVGYETEKEWNKRFIERV